MKNSIKINFLIKINKLSILINYYIMLLLFDLFWVFKLIFKIIINIKNN